MREPKRMPWFKMPLRLRALPFNERRAALDKWERTFGLYDWKKGWKKDYKDYKKLLTRKTE